jgi:hypothetical protein
MFTLHLQHISTWATYISSAVANGGQWLTVLDSLGLQSKLL